MNKKITDDPDFPVSYPDAMLINNLAYATIRGDFGNGDERRHRLGKHYDAVQKRVNELMETYIWTKIEQARIRYKNGKIGIDEYMNIIRELS